MGKLPVMQCAKYCANCAYWGGERTINGFFGRAEVSDDCHAKGVFLVATKECPKCKQAAEMLDAAGKEYIKVYAEDDATLVHKFGLTQAPVLIDMRNDEAILYHNLSDIRKFVEQ